MSAQYPHILVTDTDYEQIMTKLEGTTSEEALPLFEELNRASIVPEEHIPPDTVTMNSRVRFKDTGSEKESEITIVYPDAANVTERKVSVLAPVGTALLGLRVGSKIRWPMPNEGFRTLEVIGIDSQRENHALKAQ